MYKYIVFIFLFVSLTLFATEPNYKPLPQNYQQLKADAKQRLLWQRIESGKWEKLPKLLPQSWGELLRQAASFLTLNKTFEHQGDELPVNKLGKRRSKFIHSYGVIAKIEYIPTTKGQVLHSGIFQSGAIGFARLSLAGSPKLLDYTPGIAVKLLIDGRTSVNIFAMHSLDGQGQNQNWFAHNFSTTIPEGKKWAVRQLGKIFSLVRKPPTFLPVFHLGQYDSKGNWQMENLSPHVLILRPGKETKGLISENSQADFREELAKIRSDITLYEVWGRSKKEWEKDNHSSKGAIHIGNLVLKSKLIASHYSDKMMFFQHFKGTQNASD